MVLMNQMNKSFFHVFLLKGTTRGLSGVFLPLVMNPLCLLKATTSGPDQFY